MIEVLSITFLVMLP